MDFIFVFQFDKIVEIRKKHLPDTFRSICFRALPDAHFHRGIRRRLSSAREKGVSTALLAYGDEVLVKEALLALKACSLFDYLIIIDELEKNCKNPRDVAVKVLNQRFGSRWKIFSVKQVKSCIG